MQMKTVSDFSNLKNLKLLALRNCQCLAGLPDLSSLQLLAKLDIAGCTNIRRLEGLQGLKSLQELYLSGSEHIGLNLSQIVEDLPFLKEFSARGMQLECLQVPCQELASSNFIDMLPFPVERNSKCAGVVLFFDLELDSKETDNGVANHMEIAFKRDGEEFFSSKAYIRGDEQFMFIYRAKHPVIVALNNAQRLSIRGKGKGIHIREGGIRLYRKIEEPCHSNDIIEDDNNERNIEWAQESACGGIEESLRSSEGNSRSDWTPAMDKEKRDLDLKEGINLTLSNQQLVESNQYLVTNNAASNENQQHIIVHCKRQLDTMQGNVMPHSTSKRQALQATCEEMEYDWTLSTHVRAITTQDNVSRTTPEDVDATMERAMLDYSSTPAHNL